MYWLSFWAEGVMLGQQISARRTEVLDTTKRFFGQETLA
jgi:hypothetical protein